MTLSDKEISWMKETDWDVSDPENPEVTKWSGQSGYESKDIKEFIKNLKENPYITYNDGRQMGKAYFTELLRKLAGEKLI